MHSSQFIDNIFPKSYRIVFLTAVILLQYFYVYSGRYKRIEKRYYEYVAAEHRKNLIKS